MPRLYFSKQIDAPRQKVWDTMLGDATYRRWTDVFQPGSHFVGNWEQGSKILFLGPDDKGVMGGMVATVAESRRPEYVSTKVLGMVHNGVEDTTSEEVQKWAGSFENYSFTEADGGTLVRVELDTPSDFREYMEGAWPQALDKLKELAEQE
jgi:uncharacterized protein YndB with AHSA1/START domain